MLTEGHHNVAGVKDLIDDMVMAGGKPDRSNFNRAVMAFLSEFSEQVGEKYGLKTYSKFISELDYRESLRAGYSDINMGDDFVVEQGLYNTLRALSSFFWVFVRNLSTKNQSAQDGDEDAFLFTTIRIARKLQKEYVQVVDEIIARKDEISDSLSGEEINTLISILKMEKNNAGRWDFSSDLLSKRQRTRKNNELYGSGARTHQPKMYIDTNGKKKPHSMQIKNRITRMDDPWDRSSKFKV